MEKITSKSNEKVKFIKELNEKKFRQKYGYFYLEGIKVVNEILDMYEKNIIELKYIVYCDEILEGLNESDKLIEKIKNLNLINIVYNFDKNLFKYITDTITPQGVLAVVKIPKYNFNEYIDNINTIILLDKVQDMGNLGTIIRTSNAFNVDAILCLEGTADVYAPKVVRSTMSSILKQNILYIENEKKFEILKKLKKNNFEIISTTLQAKKYINEINMQNKKICFVMGNEANGISKEIIDICDMQVKIPMENNVESLNVSVATSIVLYQRYIQNLK